MKIILGAVISLTPFSPGMAWNWIHHALGFRKLGHDVYYVEEVKPGWCVDAQGRQCDFEHSVNRELFQTIMKRFGLMERACQLYNSGEATHGLSLSTLMTLAKDADLLINMSGHVKTDFVLSQARRRIYVDQDPVYTQLWRAEYGKELDFGKHDIFFTVGLNIGTPYTSIPDCDTKWHHTLPPVVLEHWPFYIDRTCRRFTTVASWTDYPDLCYRGEWYGSKYEEFKRFAALPRRVDQEFEIALKSYRGDDEGIQLLRSNGWLLSEAGRVADLSNYRSYIAQSRGEIGIAKNAYVKGRSGWFSDRSAHYLAAGKPVLHQSTGLERCLPTGRGLFAFGTMDEAVAAIEAINQDYEAHCRAAREFAEEYLDYRKILPRMLDLCTAQQLKLDSNRREV
ncbi:MAG: glycosyltransferase family 1 protein [Chloroflexi bacterium]|nr:glycosyltransferase family 1 protein [Chloroflexota bacterium]